MKGAKEPKNKVFVAISGGVDSSVAAALLKQRGFNVVGVHMKCFNLDGCGEQEAESARRAAEVLGIPFYVWDFEKEYKGKVVRYMIDGYRKGITPNPDVMCNREIKFGLFLKKALARGADYVATGHYVRKGERVEPKAKSKKTAPLNPIGYTLLAARDRAKDQSYFLWTLTQKQLKYCLFPIGDYTKPQIRKLARRFGLPNAEKKDSQGICFLGQVSLKDFLKNYLPEKKGIVLDTGGRIVGEHNGAHFYTIGQRHIGCANRGLTRIGRGITRTKNFKPLYVAEKDVESNAILVAEEGDPALYQKEIKLINVNFTQPITSLIRANGRIRVLARVRYRQPLVKAKLYKLSAISYKLTFEQAQKFIAPGQSAVFYLPANSASVATSAKGAASATAGGLEMLGGGIILE